MNREYHKWWSPALEREMELLVFGEKTAPRFLVFPTRQQRFFEYENHGMVHSLRHGLVSGKLQLVCVDGIDDESFYAFEKSPHDRLARHLQYERYILDEVLPFYEARSPGTTLTAHGCSLGAYHAMTIALRHPERFDGILALSGRYDLTLHVGEFYSLFHGHECATLSELMPSRFLPELRARKRLAAIRKLAIRILIGEEDPFCEDNRALSQALTAKKIRHDFHLWCGNAHRFRYWRQMVRVALDLTLQPRQAAAKVT
jgi:esterase/lipase superfamily enzyme